MFKKSFFILFLFLIKKNIFAQDIPTLFLAPQNHPVILRTLEILEKHSSSPSFSGTILFYKQNEALIFSQGISHHEFMSLNNQDTIFRWPFLTQLLTQYITLKTLYSKNISLETPFKTYAPKSHQEKYSFLIKDLFLHTAGLEDYLTSLESFYKQFFPSFFNISQKNVYELAFRQKINPSYINQYHPSHTHSVFLSYLIETLSRTSFNTLAQNYTKSIPIKNDLFPQEKNQKHNIAQGYSFLPQNIFHFLSTPQNPTPVLERPLVWEWASQGASGNTQEAYLLIKQILKEYPTEFFTKYKTQNEEFSAFGKILSDIHYNSASTLGFTCYMALFPQNQTFILILSNRDEEKEKRILISQTIAELLHAYK